MGINSVCCAAAQFRDETPMAFALPIQPSEMDDDA